MMSKQPHPGAMMQQAGPPSPSHAAPSASGVPQGAMGGATAMQPPSASVAQYGQGGKQPASHSDSTVCFEFASRKFSERVLNKKDQYYAIA